MEPQETTVTTQNTSPTNINTPKRAFSPSVVIGFIVVCLIAFLVYSLDLIDFNRINNPTTPSPTTAPTEVKGSLSIISGNADIYNEVDQLWLPVSTPIELKEGNQVRTREDSFTRIEFSDKSVIYLNSNTEISLNSIKTGIMIIDQTAGETYHRVSDNPSRQYFVKTSDVDVKALGTIFNVKLLSAKETEVKVIKNSVEVTSNDQSQKTQAISGERVTTIANENSTTQAKAIVKGDEFDSVWFGQVVSEEKKAISDLGVLTDQNKPTLEVTQPTNGYTTSEKTVLIKGATSQNATIKINDIDIAINGGVFEKTMDLVVGANQFEVKAYSPAGVKSVVSITVTRVNPQPSPTNTPTPSPIKSFSITSVTSPNAGQATVSWKFEGYDLGKGFKVTFSKNANPEYPTRDGDFATYVDKSLRTVTFEGAGLTEGGTFHVRVCRYIEVTTGSYCDLYTPDTTVNVAASDWGVVSILLSTASQSNRAINLSWEVSGTGKLTSGFKVVWANTPNPTYPKNQNSYLPTPDLWDQILGMLGIHNNVYAETVDNTWGYVYLTDPNARSTSVTLGSQFAAGTWYFRVCRYRGGYCDVYSNQIEVTVN